MAHESLGKAIDKLARAPEAIREVLATIDAGKLRTRPSPDVFSPLEDVWHLRDIEKEGYLIRISRILSENVPALEDLDGDRMAVERRYNQLELEPAIAGFTAARAESLGLLKGLPPEAWMREAHLANRVINLRTLIDVMVEHDDGHLSSIRGIYVRSIAA